MSDDGSRRQLSLKELMIVVTFFAVAFATLQFGYARGAPQVVMYGVIAIVAGVCGVLGFLFRGRHGAGSGVACGCLMFWLIILLITALGALYVLLGYRFDAAG